MGESPAVDLKMLCLLLIYALLVLLLLPETKELTLEELDAVFSVATHKQMSRCFKEPGYWINKGILRRDAGLPALVDIQELRATRQEEHQIESV